MIDQINVQQLEGIFQDLEQAGVQLQESIEWEYTFLDSKKENLEKFSQVLQGLGYEVFPVEELHDEEEEESTAPQYILTISKPEVHSAQSLIERNQELEKLTQENSVESYEGWAVGSTDIERVLELAEAFDEVKEAGLDLNSALSWEFIFVDTDQSKLESFRDALLKEGYEGGSIEKVEYEEDEEEDTEEEGTEEEFALTVKKIDIYTPYSLAAEEITLQLKGIEHGAIAYDGWQVGPVEE